MIGDENIDNDPLAPIELEDDERALADALSNERPVPAAGFRGALARRLEALDPGYGPRPPWLRPVVAGLTGAGALFVGLGVLVSAGVI